MASPPDLSNGLEWLIDAHGCDPERLRDPLALRAVFDRAFAELDLHPLDEPRFHTFPAAGGVTGMVMLTESHLTCHSFPERGYVAFDLYCCRPRPEWPWVHRLGELLGAREVQVRVLRRPG